MSSKKKQEGYLLIDNRFGPGVDAEFIKKTGKDAPVVGEGMTYESATVTCAHCQTVVILNPLRTRERGYCRKCDHYICDNPICNQECIPFKKIIDDAYDTAFKGITPTNILLPPFGKGN